MVTLFGTVSARIEGKRRRRDEEAEEERDRVVWCADCLVAHGRARSFSPALTGVAKRNDSNKELVVVVVMVSSSSSSNSI